MAGNRVVITINGVRYPIRSMEEPAYVHKLAEEMDAALRELTQQGNLSLSEALVLLGLEYLDNYHKAEQNLDNMRSQLSEYLEDAAKARLERDEARREVERLWKKHAFKAAAQKQGGRCVRQPFVRQSLTAAMF